MKIFSRLEGVFSFLPYVVFICVCVCVRVSFLAVCVNQKITYVYFLVATTFEINSACANEVNEQNDTLASDAFADEATVCWWKEEMG